MFEHRIKNIRQQLLKEKLDAVLVSDATNIIYLTGFTNFAEGEREAYIFIGKDFAYIITDARYAEEVKKQVPHLSLFKRSKDRSVEVLFKEHRKKIKKLGIEESNLTVLECKGLKKHFKNIKHFNVAGLRGIKTKEEINKIGRSCEIGDLAFNYILKKIKTGITENKIAYELENFIRSKGGSFSCAANVSFDKNSAVPHHQTGDSKLLNQPGQFILFDFGVKLDNYCSDMTRTVFFGKPTNKQKDIYQTVLAAQQKAVAFIDSAVKTGKQIKTAEVDKVARDYIISKGYPTIPHSLGHGVGLEIHEHPYLSPRSKEILKEGMVFSIEPGIYLPEFGGVRIEDLYVFEKSGLKQLTNSSKEMIVI